MEKRYTEKEIRDICINSNIHVTDHDIQVMVKLFAKPMSATEFAFDELTKMRKDKIINIDTQTFSSDDTLTLMTKFARYLGCESANKY